MPAQGAPSSSPSRTALSQCSSTSAMCFIRPPRLSVDGGWVAARRSRSSPLAFSRDESLTLPPQADRGYERSSREAGRGCFGLVRQPGPAGRRRWGYGTWSPARAGTTAVGAAGAHQCLYGCFIAQTQPFPGTGENRGRARAHSARRAPSRPWWITSVDEHALTARTPRAGDLRAR